MAAGSRVGPDGLLAVRAANRRAPALPRAPNERWAMDFIHDTLAGGATLRILSVLDLRTRKCLVLAADRSFRGEQVARVLGDLGKKRALPGRITVGNGTEFTSKALDHWAYWNRVELDFTRPGKPVEHAHVEAFHGPLRRSVSHSIDFWISRTPAGPWKPEGPITTTTGPTAAWTRCLLPTTRLEATSPRVESGSEIRSRSRPDSPPHLRRPCQNNWPRFRGKVTSASTLPPLPRYLTCNHRG